MGKRYTITMKNEKQQSNKVNSLRGEEKPEQRLAALISPSQLPRMQRPRFVFNSHLHTPPPHHHHIAESVKKDAGTNCFLLLNNITQVALIKNYLEQNQQQGGGCITRVLFGLSELAGPAKHQDHVGPSGTSWGAMGRRLCGSSYSKTFTKALCSSVCSSSGNWTLVSALNIGKLIA